MTGIACADLVQTLASKNLPVLIAGDKTGILLERSSFMRGTEDEVLTSIQKEKELHD